MIKRFEITSKEGGLGRVELSNDSISGFIGVGAAVNGGVQLNKSYKLESLDDASKLLITKEYDTTNNVLVFEHISEFFRICKNGALYIHLIEKATSYADIFDIGKKIATRLIKDSSGSIKQLGVCYTGGTATLDLIDFISKAQSFADFQEINNSPVQIILEGINCFVNNEIINFRGQNAKNVSVVIGQEISKANLYPKYAAVGTVLGATAKAKVSGSIASIRNFNLKGGSLKEPAINGKVLKDYTNGDIQTYHDKGALFLIEETGIDGYYMNGSHTCTALTSDYAYVENNRTMQKARRLVRSGILPWIESEILVDNEGKIDPTSAKAIENDGKNALNEMLVNREVSSLNVTVDPEQNILSTGKVEISFTIVPVGTTKKISAVIGFSNPFKI